MSRSLNKVELIGNLGGVPEVRTTADGVRVATFTLATTRRWTDRDGRLHEKTEWHKVVAWDQLVMLIERQLRKGDRVYVEGRVEYRSWEDRTGRKRQVTEILAREVIPLGAGGHEVE